MSDKPTFLVTGATGSIGGAAAMALAQRGARTVLLARSHEKMKLREQAIGRAVSQADVATVRIDFSDMSSVKATAAELLNRYPVIDGLVLSVGAYLQNGPTVLPSGHEAMFATNVMGPFLLTELLMERLEQSQAVVLHVIAPFDKDIDWNDVESIKNHKAMDAFNRTKTCNWVIAGELSRRYQPAIASVAFDPTFVIDKTDPTLKSRWPSGFEGMIWKMLTLLIAKHPSVAGEPIATLVLDSPGRNSLNGALFKLEKRVAKKNAAMHDVQLGKRLWEELKVRTGLEG